jgi:hypothetical protein
MTVKDENFKVIDILGLFSMILFSRKPMLPYTMNEIEFSEN